jgi:hypothetical protein
LRSPSQVGAPAWLAVLPTQQLACPLDHYPL